MELLSLQTFDDWCWITLRSERAANAAPGQYLALRRAAPGSWDALAREALFVAAADPRTGTAQLLLPAAHMAAEYLSSLRQGAQLDALGPLGRGWILDSSIRTLALAGVAEHAGALWSLAHHAVGRGLAVSVLLGVDAGLPAPPPFLLPAATEYDTAAAHDASAAAMALLTPELLAWSDLLALALPPRVLKDTRQLVRFVRLQWRHNYAQALWLPSPACSTGACGVCAVPMRRGTALACIDGPIFDLKELDTGEH